MVTNLLRELQDVPIVFDLLVREMPVELAFFLFVSRDSVFTGKFVGVLRIL